MGAQQLHFHNDEKLICGINGWCSSLAAEFFNVGTQKLGAMPLQAPELNRRLGMWKNS